MTTAPYFIHAITPLHAGVGQGAGDIDLPIARERATHMPYLPGSSLKGALRASYKGQDLTRLFGPDTNNAHEHAGTVQLSDARLLFFPVRSLCGVFAYVTSPFLLRRYRRDMNEAMGVELALPVEGPSDADECVVSNNGSVLVHNQGHVWLEDLRLRSRMSAPTSSFSALGERLGIDDFAERICILADDALSFLVETAVEITARIRLDDNTLTVTKGGLWYEESLPAETILTGIVHTQSVRTSEGVFGADAAFNALERHIRETRVIQFGGKATVGRGVCRLWLERGKQ